MLRATSATAVVLALTVVSPARAEAPLAIAKQGYFFVGGKYSTAGDKQVMNGQIYVEYQIPKKRTQAYPLVIVPGAAQTATNFNGTPDGREGWTQHFRRRGYAVYIVEQPGRGRSSYQPDTDGTQAYPQVLSVQQRFTAPEKFNIWPQARLHTQWPGTGMAGDPNFDQFFASQVPFVQQPAVLPAVARCWLQKEPARQLPNLQKLPIAIVTGEASFHGPYEHCVVKFLEQAGVHPTWLNLGAMGLHGNGHMMMLEKNSDQVADAIEKWVRKALSEKTASTPQRRASR